MSDHPVRFGWWLSSEEHDVRRLVEHAALAESIGFASVMLSDHLQPWARKQGHAGHAWTTVGAVAQATSQIEIGTGVVAMVHRSHPIVVAQAAATAAVLSDERFFLGVGTGERLNEQPFAHRWPRAGERLESLAEAIDVLRELWEGGTVNRTGAHWNVEGLRLWELPAAPPRIYVAASGPKSAQLAGNAGDGLIAVAPDARLVDTYRGAGGRGPCIAQIHVSLAASRDRAVENAHTWWPNGTVPASVLAELSRPEQFELIADSARPELIHDTVICATDAEPVIAAVDRYVAAGFDTIYVHQIGPDQERLAAFARAELFPHYKASS